MRRTLTAGRRLASLAVIGGLGLLLSAASGEASSRGPVDVDYPAVAKTSGGVTFRQQGPKLSGNGLGYSVSLSADGNTALVGTPYDTWQAPLPNGRLPAYEGSALVFTRTGSTWSQQGPKLVPSDGTGSSPDGFDRNVIIPGQFGWSVSLSADGNTALIGGPYDGGGINNSPGSGAAWVFTRSDSGWVQEGPKLPGDGVEGAGFGFSVSLSGDGNTALVGAPYNDTAWVFTRSGDTWSQHGVKLTPSDGSGFSRFGRSVALSADGRTALIGGYQDNRAHGAAWVFARTGSTWKQQGAKLVGTGSASHGRLFGSSVSISANGNTALVGAPNDGDYTGAAWVFVRARNTWAQQGSKLTESAICSRQPQFGWNVALSGDGTEAVISCLFKALVYTRTGTSWAEQPSPLTPVDAAGEAFGWRVALSRDGTTALIGGYGGSGGGAVFVFARS